MKKLILIPVLAILAACGADDARTARQICTERGLVKGTPEYAHCMVDERRAEDLSKENKSRIK